MNFNRHIIIDGPDGAGKSLLCSILSKITGMPIHHLSQVSKYGKLPIYSTYEELLDNPIPTIYDRFYYSEIVYSRIKARVCGLSNSDVEKLDEIISRKAVVILATAESSKILAERAKKRGETFVTAYEIEQARRSYDRFMKPKANLVINKMEKLHEIITFL